jgi:hypothetical protein
MDLNDDSLLNLGVSSFFTCGLGNPSLCGGELGASFLLTGEKSAASLLSGEMGGSSLFSGEPGVSNLFTGDLDPVLWWPSFQVSRGVSGLGLPNEESSKNLDIRLASSFFGDPG